MMTADTRAILGVLGIICLGTAALVSYPHPVMAQTDEDAQAIAESKDDVYQKLTSKKYAELERQFAGHVDLYAAGKISGNEFASKFAIFDRFYGLESRFDEWVSAYPKSYPARLARGIYRVSDAWRKRGSEVASKTTDMQVYEFTEGLKKAAADLQASIELYSRPVESYRYLIRVSMGLGLGAERGLLDAALKLDQEAYYPRYAYLTSITPKWRGSEQAMDAFLEECKQSAMSSQDKVRIEVEYHSLLAQQASWEKNYVSASERYLRAYRLDNDAKWLYWAARSAQDGGFIELAFSQFDELIKTHPKYEWGYTRRGLLYERHLKEDGKAFKDYLAAAELGNSWAQNRVGWWYMTGRYVAVDYAKAEIYFRRAATQNNRTAIANLKQLEKLRRSVSGK